MKIIYVDKDEISPAFGMYFYSIDMAYIRNDLPKRVQAFVTWHEQGHSDGYGEILSTLRAIPQEPIGFVLTMILSLSLERLKYYFKRVREWLTAQST